MKYTGKGCYVYPYTYAYDEIKIVPIVQETTSYDKPETEETKILILNDAIWMVEKMEHTLVNPNQICYYGITLKKNLFTNYPILISTEDHELSMTLVITRTVLGVSNRTANDRYLQTLPHTII